MAKTAKLTTPLPILMSTMSYEKKFLPKQQILLQQQKSIDKLDKDIDEDESAPSFMSLNVQPDSNEKAQKSEEDKSEDISQDDSEEILNEQTRDLKKNNPDKNADEAQNEYQLTDEQEEEDTNTGEMEATENGLKFVEHKNQVSHMPEVDERVKQISHKIEKIVNNEQMFPMQHHAQHHFLHQDNNHDDDDLSRQSFLSLTDLIRTLRPNDKQIIPQIDSDYSNAMRVLGENSGPLVKTDETRGAGVNFREI